jgi:hypothetical protein
VRILAELPREKGHNDAHCSRSHADERTHMARLPVGAFNLQATFVESVRPLAAPWHRWNAVREVREIWGDLTKGKSH